MTREKFDLIKRGHMALGHLEALAGMAAVIAEHTDRSAFERITHEIAAQADQQAWILKSCEQQLRKTPTNPATRVAPSPRLVVKNQ